MKWKCERRKRIVYRARLILLNPCGKLMKEFFELFHVLLVFAV
jgi:hypothetical protein